MKVSEVLKSIQDMQHKLLCLSIILVMIYMQAGVMAGSFLFPSFFWTFFFFFSFKRHPASKLSQYIGYCCRLVRKQTIFGLQIATLYSTVHCVQDQCVELLLKLLKRQSSLIGFPFPWHLTVLWPCSSAPWPELTAFTERKKQQDQEVITSALLWCCDSRVKPVMRRQTRDFPAVYKERLYW